MVSVSGSFRTTHGDVFWRAFVDYSLRSNAVEVRFEGRTILSLHFPVPEARRLAMGEPALATLAGQTVTVERVVGGWRVDGFVLRGADRLNGAVEHILDVVSIREALGWR